MHFEGKFEPPALGKTVAPIEIAGPGSCAVSEEGLKVSGHESKSQSAIYWLLFGGFVIAVYAIKIEFEPPSWAFYAILGVGIALLLGTGARIGQKRKLGKAIRLTIPWESVSKFDADGESPETVVVTIRKFKPKGALFFTPASGAESFLQALREHSPKP